MRTPIEDPRATALEAALAAYSLASFHKFRTPRTLRLKTLLALVLALAPLLSLFAEVK